MASIPITFASVAAMQSTFPPETMFYTLRQMSRSGGTCFIRFFTIKDAALRERTRDIADFFGYPMVERGGFHWIKRHGAADTQITHILYDLHHKLYPSQNYFHNSSIL